MMALNIASTRTVGLGYIRKAENLNHTAHLLERRHQVVMTLLLRLGGIFRILMVSHHVCVGVRS